MASCSGDIPQLNVILAAGGVRSLSKTRSADEGARCSFRLLAPAARSTPLSFSGTAAAPRGSPGDSCSSSRTRSARPSSDWRRDFTPGRSILKEIEEARAPADPELVDQPGLN